MNLLHSQISVVLLVTIISITTSASIPVSVSSTELTNRTESQTNITDNRVTTLSSTIYRTSKEPKDAAPISSVQALRREFRVEGGLIEVLEWLFVALLVAPGTFPLLACVFMTCNSAVQRASVQYAIIVHLLGTCTAMFCVHNIYIYKHNEKMRRERDFFLASRRSYPSINPLSRLLICLGKTKHKRLLYRNLKDTTKKEESLLNYHTRKYLMFGDCVGRVENLKLQSVSLQGILEFLKQNSSRCCLLPKLWNRLPGPLILAILNRVWSLIESTFAKFFILDMSNYVSDIEDERFWENSRTKNYEEILRNGGVVTRLRTDDETMDKIFNKYLQEMINLTNYRQRMAYDLSKNIFGILLPSGVAVTIEGQTVTQEQISEGFIQRKLGYLKRGIYSVLGYSSSLEYHQIADDDGSKPEHVNMSDDMLRFIMSSIEHEAMKERKEGIPLTSGLSVLFVPTLSHVIRLIFDFVFNISAIMPSGCKRTEVGVCITTTTTAIFLAVASWELYLLNLVKRNKERAERNNEDSLSRIDHYLDLYRKCQRDTDI